MTSTVDRPRLQPAPDALLGAVLKHTKNWEAALRNRRTVPNLIYHYCDANALLGIFHSNSVWATGARYLNDKTELVSLMRNVPEHLKRFPDTPATLVLRERAGTLVKMHAEIISHAIGMEQFVACFSADGDVLSQWCAYGDDGRGFAIGFAPSELAVLQGEAILNGDIREMMYGPEGERDLVDSLIKGLIETVEPFVDILDTTGWEPDPEGAAPLTARQWLGLRFSECLGELTFESKHASFREEREWRLYAQKGQVQFRAAPRGIVPYRQVDMRAATSKLMPIKRIIMGPRLDYLDTTRVLMYLADEHGYGHSAIDLDHSKCPYR
ncbi:MAG TPA: DUF2971 domain-containing protein [Stellaceae bacterium]|nr:DUF2971 domain-containing protein [Stellaceae bacterium]HMD65474.1 DUF2971 domain-containing protein [Stellaceae bacterium]